MGDFKTPEHKKTKDEPGASVDEQIDDSFPASDPPSYNAGGRVGWAPSQWDLSMAATAWGAAGS